MALGGPTTFRVGNRQVYGSRFLFLPHRTRNLFAVQQVMLDPGEDATPVTAIHRLVNNPANFDVNPIATQNPIVDATKQIQQPALFPR